MRRKEEYGLAKKVGWEGEMARCREREDDDNDEMIMVRMGDGDL